MRLNAMAAFLAPNIATKIHNNVSHCGNPSVAINALIIANGSAKTVC